MHQIKLQYCVLYSYYIMLNHVDDQGKNNHPSECFHVCSSTEWTGGTDPRSIDSTWIPDTIGQPWHWTASSFIDNVHTTPIGSFNIVYSTSAGCTARGAETGATVKCERCDQRIRPLIWNARRKYIWPNYCSTIFVVSVSQATIHQLSGSSIAFTVLQQSVHERLAHAWRARVVSKSNKQFLQRAILGILRRVEWQSVSAVSSW